MSDTVIQIDNVWKKYRLGVVGTGTLAHDFNRWWHRVRGKPDPYLKVGQELSAKGKEESAIDNESNGNGESTMPLPLAPSLLGPDEIWALRGVSLEIKQGEIVGIIGRNGAGKSTLLKILSRVTAPTQGEIRIRGRVASLLEVGTGFHPELTGRENIFLNGAILGMSTVEIRHKLDEIVGFAEVQAFIDTPVKRYSSGMYVRLAFAVAAHLDPEILIIDEVLSVGDMHFQQRCLGKIRDVSSCGRTVLFVSHNMGVIANLCSKGVILDQGTLTQIGPVGEAIAGYSKLSQASKGEVTWNSSQSAPQSSNVRLLAVRISVEAKCSQSVSIDHPFEIQVDFETVRPGLRLSTSFHLIHQTFGEVLSTANFPSASLTPDEWFWRSYPLGIFRSTCTVPPNLLNEGTFLVNVVILNKVSNIELLAREVIQFEVHDTGGMRAEWGGHWIGVVRPRLAWRTQCLNHS